MGDDLFTTKEAAEKLGYPPKTIRQYVMRGLLKVVKRGPLNFVPGSEIERFKSEHKPKPRKQKKQKDE